MQHSLNISRTLQHNSNLTAYKKVKCWFDWNKTPIALLGTKEMIYIATNAWTTFAPHCDKAFITGMTQHHCHFFEFCMPATCEFCISGTYHLNSAYWTMSTVSKAHRTMLAVINLLEKLKKMPPLPTSAQYKAQYSQCIRTLCATITTYSP